MESADASVGARRTYVAKMLQLEGAALLVAAVLAFRALGGSWLWFFVLFLVPDLFMVGYLKDEKVGAWIYNAAHTLLVPAIFGGIWWMTREPEAGRIGALWTAHIAFDRLVGYGLKDVSGFKVTHLQRI